MLKKIHGVIFTWDLVEKCLLIGLSVGVVSAVLGAVLSSSLPWLYTISTVIFAVAAVIYFSQIQINPNGKAVLITGCDTGFGNAIAPKLHDMGFTVFATCLSDTCDGARHLQEIKSDRMHVLAMNVTNDDSIKSAMEYVQRHTGTSGLWAIINNAGWSTYGEIEWLPMSVNEKILQINLLGPLRVSKWFLPLIRKARGRIINVASGLGRTASPLRASYVMSKWGLEGLSDSMRFDLKPWGVDVIVIEPGNHIAGTSILTGIVDGQAEEMWNHMTDEIKKDYGEEYFKSRVERMRSFTNAGVSDLSAVLYAMEQAVCQKYPQRRYQPADWPEKLRIFTYTHLPERIYELYILRDSQKRL